MKKRRKNNKTNKNTTKMLKEKVRRWIWLKNTTKQKTEQRAKMLKERVRRWIWQGK